MIHFDNPVSLSSPALTPVKNPYSSPLSTKFTAPPLESPVPCVRRLFIEYSPSLYNIPLDSSPNFDKSVDRSSIEQHPLKNIMLSPISTEIEPFMFPKTESSKVLFTQEKSITIENKKGCNCKK